jgi:drug/metabolite transporter (DMT)-like permease
MYHYIVGVTIAKSLRPYIKKHIMTTLDTHDFLFMNTFFVGIIVLCVFLYKLLFDQKIDKTFTNIKNMSILQIVSFLILAIFTVASSLVFLEFDKKHNTPLINNMITKFISLITVALVSIVIFKEEYTFYQYLGLVFTMIGIILITGSKK